VILSVCGLISCLLGCASNTDWQQVRDEKAVQDWRTYQDRAPQLDGPLDLKAALELAQVHNVEVWVAAKDREFQHELLTRSRLKMLPMLEAGSIVSERTEYDAASSRSLQTGEETLEPSYSSERTAKTFDASFMWNLLDFGIGFYREQQAYHREQIAAYKEQRVRQNLAYEVTKTWWRAVTARDLSNKAAVLSEEIAEALEATQREQTEQTISELEGLARQAALMEDLNRLREYREQFYTAKAKLAQLIGLPPGVEYTLAPVDFDDALTGWTPDLESLQRVALRQRPELFEKDSEEAITEHEVVLALLEVLPRPELFWRFSYDDNRFLAFHHWHNAGLRATWDLLAVPAGVQRHEAAKVQQEVIERQRLAVAVAILTQLHLAAIEYDARVEEYKQGKALCETRDNLAVAVQRQVELGKGHAAELLTHKIKALRARAGYLLPLADVKAAQARILNTAGVTTVNDAGNDAVTQLQDAHLLSESNDHEVDSSTDVQSAECAHATGCPKTW
jgi:outer membrane protein TolC